jgi:PKD repeat protein
MTNALTGGAISLDELCLGLAVTLEASSENAAIDRFIWDFGDGSAQMVGQAVTHRFDRAGTFTINVTGMESGAGACTAGEALEFTVTLNPAPVDELDSLIGTQQICPGAEGVAYTLAGNGYADYQWSVEGGSIASNDGATITVDWGMANANASVAAFGVTDEGCYTDTLVLPVVISENQTVSLPITGDSLICPKDWTGKLYSITPNYTNTSTSWTWQVAGGTVTDNPSDAEALVDWEPTAPQHYITALQQEEGAVTCLFPSEDTLRVNVKEEVANQLTFDFVSWPEAGLTDDQINLRYAIQSNEINDEVAILRRATHPDNEPTMSELGNSTTGQFADLNIAANDQYAYQLKAGYACNGQTFLSDEVRSVLLVSSMVDEVITLEWTGYAPWPLADYQVWQKIDTGDYGRITSFSGQRTLNLVRPEDASGLCFKVSAFDPTGPDRAVWSNESCVDFGDRPLVTPLITPNGDGINDQLIIQNDFLLSSYEMILFNRWGQQQFKTDDLNTQPWMPEAAGTYFYVLKGLGRNGEKVTLKGAVTVVF